MSRIALAGLVALLAAASFMAGCAGTDETSEPLDPNAEKLKLAIKIYQEIDADPDRAEQILEAHGITEEAFEELMYEIAADPEMSAEFNAAKQ